MQLEVDVSEPQLRRLVRGLEQRLVRIDELVDRLLQLEQLRNADVALVVGVASAFENRAGVRLSC